MDANRIAGCWGSADGRSRQMRGCAAPCGRNANRVGAATLDPDDSSICRCRDVGSTGFEEDEFSELWSLIHYSHGSPRCRNRP